MKLILLFINNKNYSYFKFLISFFIVDTQDVEEKIDEKLKTTNENT